MKIYHISDLHIGRDLNGYDLLEDQKYVLNQIVKKIEENNIKYLLLAGDIFDKYNPSNDAMIIFEDFISNLSKLNTRTIIISGNHDSKVKLNYLSNFLSKYNIYIYTSLPENPLEFDDDMLSFFPIPYLHEFELQSSYKDLGNNPLEIYSALIKDYHNKASENFNKICLCHNLIIGGKTSTSERSLSIGGIDEMPNSLFFEFDYTALGHLHICQKMGNNIYYSGSIIKYSISEFNNVNSLIEYDTDTNISTIIPIPQYRNCRVITGEMSELLENAILDPNKEDYISVELTDNGIVYDAMKRLSQFYPYIVNISQVNRPKKIESNTENPTTMTEQAPIETFKEFYKYIQGDNPTNERVEYIKKIIDSLETKDED